MTNQILTLNEKRTVTELVKAGAPIYVDGVKFKLWRDCGPRLQKQFKSVGNGEVITKKIEATEYCRLLAAHYIRDELMQKIEITPEIQAAIIKSFSDPESPNYDQKWAERSISASAAHLMAHAYMDSGDAFAAVQVNSSKLEELFLKFRGEK